MHSHHSKTGASKMTDLTVANTIKSQIGGRALMMIGACNLMGDANSLTMKIRGSRQVSHIRIRLEASDLYTVTFIKCTKAATKEVAKCADAYAEDLHELITEHTGLYTSL